jgi:hypothetical protein
MKGYKAFNKDLKCRGFQFVVGKTYKIEGKLKICEAGFHFCEKLNSVYNYYPKSVDTRVCEVESLGLVDTKDDKSCTNHIKIIRELSKEEISLLTDDLKFNSGDRNSGHYNSGHRNPGDYNSGHRNSGHRNSGDYNSGRYNSGHRNSGDYNSGNYNSGDYNSGRYNSGHYNSGHYNSGRYNSGRYNSGNSNSGNFNSGNLNSGDYNSGNRNSGFFNTLTPYVTLFNKKTNLRWDSIEIQKLYSLNVKPILQWVYESSMTEEEKKNFPSYKTTGGFLKNTGRNDWSKLTEEDKKLITSLPGYDDEIFKQITGVSLKER